MRFAWLLLVGVVMTACAPARVELDPRVRERLPTTSVVHLVVYPADAPSLTTAKAIGTGSLFGAIGGVVVAGRAAAIGKELMEKQGAENLSVQLASKLNGELKATLPNLKRVTEPPADDEVATLKKAGLVPLVLDVRSAGNIMYTGRTGRATA